MKLSPQKTGIVLILPSVVLILSLLVYPVLYGVWLSFFKKHSFFPGERFVGLSNYIYLLKDSEFWMSVWYGTVYAISTISLQIILGMIAALIVNEAFKGRNFVRGVILFPYVIPTVVAIILWKWLLNNQFGLVNYLMLAVGINSYYRIGIQAAGCFEAGAQGRTFALIVLMPDDHGPGRLGYGSD